MHCTLYMIIHVHVYIHTYMHMHSHVCNVDREWVYGVGFFLLFLNFPVWLVCYAHVFHVIVLVYLSSKILSLCSGRFLDRFHRLLQT